MNDAGDAEGVVDPVVIEIEFVKQAGAAGPGHADDGDLAALVAGAVVADRRHDRGGDDATFKRSHGEPLPDRLGAGPC